ncbi:hypothetical protein QAD02_005527 [Eretmocerus hayati]|uniref:Uncharacterized protein n=1 Tax=Eretmocerus hayati TaxID=131215 RepID=A0ACC2NXK0_9HYME|nr:hypothetical protein QAD02_005527 [Eretmocerus hayati]
MSNNVSVAVNRKQSKYLEEPRAEGGLTAKGNDICGYDIANAVSAMNFVLRNQDTSQRERKNHFEQLFSILKQHMQKLTGKEAVQILLILRLPDVPQNLSLYSKLLTYVLDHMDHLTIEEYLQISYSTNTVNVDVGIKKYVHDCLVSKVAGQIQTAISQQDIEYLYHALHLMSKVPDQQKHHELLETLFEALCCYPKRISTQIAVSILISISDLKCASSSSWRNLVHRIQDEIVQETHLLDELQIKRIASAFTSIFKADGDPDLLKERFLDKVANEVINNHMGISVTVPVAARLIEVRHKNKGLINYACSSFFTKSYQNKINPREKSKYLEALINLLGYTNIKPVSWNKLQHCITESRELLDLSYERLLHVTVNLLVFNWCPTQLIEKVINSASDFSGAPVLTWRFCRMYQKLKSDPSYSGPMPTQFQLENIEKSLNDRSGPKTHLPLLSYLRKAISNPLSIKSNLRTQLFHRINHAIAFNEDGTLAEITTKSPTDNLFKDGVEYLENLEVPTGCRIILIVMIPQFWFFKNTKDLLGEQQMYLETLEMLYGHPVVVINQGVWDELSHEERTPFLINKIRAKIKNPVLEQKLIDCDKRVV